MSKLSTRTYIASESRDKHHAAKIRPVPLLDWFLPEHIISHDKLYRGRVLIGMLLSYALLIYSAAVFFYAMTPLSDEIRANTTLIMPTLATVFLVMCFVYKYTGAHLLVSNINIAAIFLGVTVGVYISGGPVISPVTPIVPCSALLAFCLSGRRSGFAWAGMVLATQMIFYTMESLGFTFPNVLASDTTNINAIVDWIIAFSALIATVSIYELMQSRIKDELESERKKYAHLATHDQLTQIPNRVLFYDRLQQAAERANREKTSFCVLYLDLDGFKPINDQYGHEAGDLVLEETAQRLQRCLRKSDTVARLGGDEFAIILENVNKSADADELARKIGFKVSKSIPIDQTEVRIKTSIGIAQYPQDSKDLDDLVRCADAAMYHAKNSPELSIAYQAIAQAKP